MIGRVGFGTARPLTMGDTINMSARVTVTWRKIQGGQRSDRQSYKENSFHQTPDSQLPTQFEFVERR
jgi:hypothetical protein